MNKNLMSSIYNFNYSWENKVYVVGIIHALRMTTHEP